MKNYEVRTLNVAVRAAKKDAFEINGTAVTYNTLSQDLGGFRERIAPGCFTRALADSKTDVRMLFNHNQSAVLGRQANGTLTIFDTPTGLNFRCKLDPNQQAHRDLHSSIKRGDINSCSFAFKPEDGGDDWEEVSERSGARYTRRTVKAAQIFDISVVCQPAYNSPGATSVTARSFRPTAHRTEKSLEQQYLERHGREYVSPAQLEARLYLVGQQVERDARYMEEQRRLDEIAAAEVKALLFPWEN